MLGNGYEIRTRQGGVKRRVLSEVVRRVVEAAAPEKIILFGSAARGEMGATATWICWLSRRANSAASGSSRPFIAGFRACARRSMS